MTGDRSDSHFPLVTQKIRHGEATAKHGSDERARKHKFS
jgi:hypothetical protein